MAIKRSRLEHILEDQINIESEISVELYNNILAHLDSIMHKAMIFSANIAISRKNRKLTSKDVLFALVKLTDTEYKHCFNFNDNVKDNSLTEIDNECKLLKDVHI